MMNSRFAIQHTGIALLFLSLSALVGCDKISSWYDNATQKTPPKNVTPVSVPPPSSSVTPTSSVLPDNVVARVGNWSMTTDEFNERLAKLKEVLPDFDPANANSKRLILEELIRQQLLVMDAEQSGLAAKKDIVETVEDFRKTLLVQELATNLTKDVKASDGEALEYYEKNKNEFLTKTEWKIREIQVPEEGQAKEILVQLLQGSDFAEMAKARSKSASAEQGGDLGMISKFPFDQMKSAVTSLEIGKVSGVFSGPDGYYIVKLEDKKGGSPRSFESVKTDVVKALTLRKQQEAVLEYLNKLASKTQIQVNEELIK